MTVANRIRAGLSLDSANVMFAKISSRVSRDSRFAMMKQVVHLFEWLDACSVTGRRIAMMKTVMIFFDRHGNGNVTNENVWR